MKRQRIGLGLTALGVAIVMNAGSATAVVTNPEQFEGYATGAWTPGGPTPSAGVEGWTVDIIGGSPTFDIDATDGFAGTQTLRVQAQGSSSNRGHANWHVSANTGTAPQQTIHGEFEGILRNDASFGRVFFNFSDLNFVEFRSDSAFPSLRYDSDPGAGVTAADIFLPTDVVAWSWASNTIPTAWYAVEVDLDYSTGQVRARFGTHTLGPDTLNWNSWTAWVDMFSTAQPTQVTTSVEGRAHLDNYSFTAIPEPATLALLGLGGLLMVARRR